MKFQIKTIEDFDGVAEGLDLDKIEKPKDHWILNPFRLIAIQLQKLWKKLSAPFKQELPPSLLRLTLKAYFTACQTTKPSDFLKAITEDLHLHITDIDQAISCWKLWVSQIKDISTQFEKSQPDIKQDGFSQATWNNIMQKHKLPSHIWVVDKIATRFGITYEQAYEITCADALIAITIDSCNSEYESKLNDHALQESKKKH